jgi:hypothetical protein
MQVLSVLIGSLLEKFAKEDRSIAIGQQRGAEHEHDSFLVGHRNPMA